MDAHQAEVSGGGGALEGWMGPGRHFCLLHPQVNCLAFNPYSEYILATGSADKVYTYICIRECVDVFSVAQLHLWAVM